METIDVLPTIADVLGVKLPYRADGVSLRRPHSVPSVAVYRREGGVVPAPAAEVGRLRNATVARQARLFGAGSWSHVYGIGPNRDLIGSRVPRSTPVSRESVSIDGGALLRNVDPTSQLSPGHITGRASTGPLDLAVAVNGTVAAVTRTYSVDGDDHWGAFVPDTAFRRHGNTVAVYAVRHGRLERLRGGVGAAEWSLDGSELRSGDRVVRGRPGALDGLVEDWYRERESVRFGGWSRTRAGVGSPMSSSSSRAAASSTRAPPPSAGSGFRSQGRSRTKRCGSASSSTCRGRSSARARCGSSPFAACSATELRYVEDFPWEAEVTAEAIARVRPRVDALAAARWATPAILVALTAVSLVLRTRELGAGFWIDEGISVGIAHHPLHRRSRPAAPGRLAAAVLHAAARLDRRLRRRRAGDPRAFAALRARLHPASATGRPARSSAGARAGSARRSRRSTRS